MRILVFDTETTGLPPNNDRSVNNGNLQLWPYIMQLSYIVHDTEKGENVEIFDTIIDIPDDAVISEKSIEIHKITREKSRELGNDIKTSLLFFFTSLADVDLLVGHNITFDLNMVYAEIMRCPELIKYIPLLEEKRKFCTMKESTAFCCIPLKNSNSYNSEQLVAGILLIKKCKNTEYIFDNIMKILYCNPLIITDFYNNDISNNNDFITNRHDQSIISLAIKEFGENIKVIPKDETWFEPFGNNESLKYPFWATRLRI